MKSKNLINEIHNLQKIAGLLKEDEDFDLSNNPLAGPKFVDNIVYHNDDEYDIADGIAFPYDDGDTAQVLKAIANKLGYKEGIDYEFGYERGDTPETADPSFFQIHNNKMVKDTKIQKIILDCIDSYDQDEY